MSTETVNGAVVPATAKSDNPFLASFRPYIPAGVQLRELLFQGPVQDEGRDRAVVRQRGADQ